MKEKILQLHNAGKSYNEITKILKCSKGLVSYYVNPEGKAKTLDRQTKNRFARRKKYKVLAGGKCQKCGYNRCLDALCFHHKDPSKKEFELSTAFWGSGISEERILKEIKKCILLCSNCHIESHSNYYN